VLELSVIVYGADAEVIDPIVPVASPLPPTSVTASPVLRLLRLVALVRVRVVWPSTSITPSTLIEYSPKLTWAPGPLVLKVERDPPGIVNEIV
jgi:hypothetical protein